MINQFITPCDGKDRLEMKKVSCHHFFRFLLVGASSTLLDYIIYWYLSMAIHFNLAKGISMTCSCIYSYIFNKSFTFKNTNRTSGQHVLRYIISQVINIAINTGINALIYGITGFKLLGMAGATGIAMIANYMVQKFFVFNFNN